MMIIRDKFVGCFLGTAIGDAFGLPYEFSQTVNEVEVLERASRSEFWGYSDDTEMMIGLSEVLTAIGEFDPQLALITLAENYEPARGYGKGMKMVFRHVDQGLPWQDAAFTAWQQGSLGNGSSSRIAPIACFYHDNLAQLITTASLSSSITHAHQHAKLGASLQALSIAYLLPITSPSNFSPPKLLDFLLQQKIFSDSLYEDYLEEIKHHINTKNISYFVDTFGNGVKADESVPLSLAIFLQNAMDFEKAIIEAIKASGDTDTIGALVGALSGALHGVNVIPKTWCQNLEQRGKGYHYIVQQAENLYEIWRRKASVI